MFDDKATRIEWDDLVEIIAALQIATGHAYGVKRIKLLIDAIHNGGLAVHTPDGEHLITAVEVLQQLISDYDPRISLKDLI
jgi:hypothetical protein